MQPLSHKARAGIGAAVVFIAALAVACAWHITATIGTGDNPSHIIETPTPVGATSTPDRFAA